MRIRLLFVSAIAIALAPAFAAPGDPSVLKDDPGIKAAFEAVRRNEPEMIELQARLCAIPAPPSNAAITI